MLRKPHKILYILSVLLCFFIGSTVMEAAKKNDDGLHTARYYASRALQHQDNYAWEASKREIDAGLEEYPDDPDLRYLNGRYYYYAQHDIRQARYNLIKSLQADDQHYMSRRLLVDVEEDAGHYSSAICYINELLEFEPYDRDLWRRKIYLYNKIGHTVEADQALERLARIYPSDSVVQRDLTLRNRETWNAILQTTSLSEAAANLEHYIEHDPTNLDYYFRLIDIYRKLGEYDRALGTVNMALYYSPDNEELLRLGANILSTLGENLRALYFLRENRVTGGLYNSVLKDVVEDDRMRDPYEASGRLYARTRDRDALAYLLNISLTRGYYDDAKYYLNEAMKIYGVTTDLLMKEYALEKRFGNEEAQMRLLRQLYAASPEDADLKEQYKDMMLELASRDMENEQWGDALTHLQRALDIMEVTDEGWPAAISRQITILGRQGKLREAQWVYEHAARLSPSHRDRFASAYEEVAANNLKGLIDTEQYATALEAAETMLKVLPGNETAMRACVNLSQTLKRDKLFWHYAAMGYELFPDNPFFIIKQAVALEQQGDVARALSLLEPRADADEYVNQQLSTAFQGVTAEWANTLLKDKMPDMAMMLIDRALEQNPQNKELLHAKGLAYEQLKQYDKAYEYQVANYNPSNAEQSDWYQHMRYLRFRGYRNRVDAGYTYAAYDTRANGLGSVAHMYSIATVSYSHLTTRNTYTLQASYKGIDGYIEDNYWDSGGMGLELAATWEHVFNHKWTGMISASWANQFFNKYGFNIGASYDAGRGWTPSVKAGYRRTPPTVFYFAGEEAIEVENNEYNLFIGNVSIEKAWARIRTSAGIDISRYHGNYFYNVAWKGKLFINEDNMSAISLNASYGSFPELNFFDQSILGNVERANASVGFDFQYLLTKNFFVGINGTWNTFYNPLRAPDGRFLRAYRNVYLMGAQIHVAF